MNDSTQALHLVAVLAVLVAVVGAAPVGAATAVDRNGVVAGVDESGDSRRGDAPTASVDSITQDGGLNATFERHGDDVVVRIPAGSFGENTTNPQADLTLVDYNGTANPEGNRKGDEYVFRVRLPVLVGDAPVTDRGVRVRLSTAVGNDTGRVDARYLAFPNRRVAVRGGSFGFVVRSIGFADGSPVSMRVAERNGQGTTEFDATLRSDAGTERLWFDPSTFAGSVPPLVSLRFTALPGVDVVNVSRRAELTTHARAGAATFVDDGDRVRVGHPLLFDGTGYVVVAETTDPDGRYVRRTTAGRSGEVGAVPVPRSLTAARDVNVTVLTDGTRVFRGASPAAPDPKVSATWVNASGADSRSVAFRFEDDLPGTVDRVWLSHHERVWSVSENLTSDGANLTVPGEALRVGGTGPEEFGLLVVGGDGSVLRANATVSRPEAPGSRNTTGSPGGFGPRLTGILAVAALLLGVAVALVSAHRPRGDLSAGAVVAAVGPLLWLFGTVALVEIPRVSNPPGLLGVVLVGVASAGLTASVAEEPIGVHRSVGGIALAVVMVALTAVVGDVLVRLSWQHVVAIALPGAIGSVAGFVAVGYLTGGSAGTVTNRVTVALVDRRTGRPTNATVDVTARPTDGRARTGDTFTVTDGEAVRSFRGGRWRFDPSRGSAVQETIEGATRVEIPVDPTGVEFVARDPDGEPVTGATVTVSADGQERRLTTDGDGVASDRLPAGVGEVEVRVDHDRYEPVTGTLDATDGLRERVELQPLTGELEAVVTLDGEEVRDVAVVAEPGSDVAGEAERTTTDRAGRATFDALPIGEYTVGVDLSATSGAFDARSATVTVPEDRSRTEGLTVRFGYRLPGDASRRIDEVRGRLDAVTSHPRSDMSIPAFYASVIEELLRTVERVPGEGTTFLATGESPSGTVEALLAAAEAGVDAVDEAMSDKQNVDLFAACADMEPAGETWDGSFSLSELFELAGLRAGERRGRVAEHLDAVNDRIGDELRGLSEVGPARSAWEQTRDLASDRSREGLEAAAATMLAEALLEATEALFEREALRERMTRTVF